MADVRINLRVIDNFSNTLRTYQREMDRSAEATRKAGNAAGGTAKEMSVMDKTIKAALGAITIGAAYRFSQEMYRVGLEVRVASAALEKLSANVGGLDRVMQAVRSATGGVVDDLTLMHGANRFLTMGIAQTADEVAKFTQAALVMGRVMGYSGQEAIESFSLLLSNESVLRLDNFGLSAATIRRRIAELREENDNWTRSDAFRAAVLEEISNKFGLLGDAAEEAYTPVNRLATILENLQQSASVVGSTVLDKAAETIFIIADGIDAINRANAQNAVLAQADQVRGEALYTALSPQMDLMRWNATTGESMGSWGFGPIPERNQEQLFFAFAQAIREGMDPNNMDEVMAAFEDAFIHDVDWNANTLVARVGEEIAERDIFGNIKRIDMDAVRQMAWSYWSAAVGYMGDLETAQAPQPRQELYRAIELLVRQPEYEANPRVYDPAAAAGMYNPAWTQYERWGSQRSIDNYEQMAHFMTTRSQGSYGGATLLSNEELDRMQQFSNAAMETVEILRPLHEQGLISDSAWENAQRYQTSIDNTIDKMRDARAEFDALSMSQMFGQQGGGRRGEVDDAVIAQLRASGADESLIESMLESTGLSTGRLTEASIQYEQEVLPFLARIASQFGADAYITARNAYDAAIAEQKANGGVVRPMDFMDILGYREFSYSGTSNQTTTVGAGDTLWGIARANGISVEELQRMNGLTGSFITPGQELITGQGTAGGSVLRQTTGLTNWEERTFGPAVSEVQQGLQDALAGVTTVTDALSAGFSTALEVLAQGVTVPVDIQVTAATRDALTQLIVAVIQANGGRPPGSSNYIGGSSMPTFD